MAVAGPISSMTFVRDSTVLACAIGNKIFIYKVMKFLICLNFQQLLSSSLIMDNI